MQKKEVKIDREHPRVLLVIEDSLFMEALIKRLNKAGMFTLTTSSDQELPEILDKQTVDVVLLDIRQPSDSAMQKLAEIKQKQPKAETILISSAENIRQSMEGMKQGASDDITAPCEVGSLMAKIHDAWQRGNSKRANSNN